MFKPQWATVSLDLTSLEAAKKDHRIVSPDPILGTLDKDEVSIEVPPYQRGLVWTQKHGEQFQEALKKGWPIGQLVLAERPSEPLPGSEASLRKFELIDGQQRTWWLNRTRDNFFRETQYSLDGSAARTAVAELAWSRPSAWCNSSRVALRVMATMP